MSNKHGAPNKRKAKVTVGRSVWRTIRNTFLGLFLITVIVVTGILAGMFVAVSKEMEDLNVENAALNFSSFIYANDDNGNSVQIEHLYDEGNRIWVDSEDIPKIMKDAVVSIEDERFYSHIGFDVKRTTGAFVKWALNKIGIGSSSYGGSTITQQLIKNITKDSDRTATRKLNEIMRAVALERQLSKDEILTMYLNIVYFANNCYGVQAAANVYFGKDVGDLSLAQAATIAGITQKPSAYDPFKHPDKTIEKRNIVLAKMLELGCISQQEYETASSEEMIVNTEYKAKKAQISSYFVDQVINDVINDLQSRRGYSETYAEQQVYNGGLKIYSTVDMKIQSIMESVFTDSSNFPKVSGESAQSAMVITDPYTGQVKGLVGGLGKKTDRRGLNRATQSYRQPGSAIKPLAAYAAAYQNNKLTSSSIIVDEKITFGKWSPKNSYSGYKGIMLPRHALEISANIPAVKVVDESGVNFAYNFMKNTLNFSQIDERDMGLSQLALGGLTIGVSPKEMAAGYSIFVNGGQYIQPYTYTKVVDESGKVLLENKSERYTALSSENAFIVADLLSDVVNGSSGTGRAAKLSNMPTFGKTGTTNDDKDRWFVGFTPYYVGAVWYGFDQPKSIKSAGVTYNPATRVWKTVMEKVHSGLAEKELTVPEEIVSKEICVKTGKIAVKGCESSMEYFVKGTQPKTTCDSRHSGYVNNNDDSGEEISEEIPEITSSPSTAVNTDSPIHATSSPSKEPSVTSTPASDEKPTPESTKKPTPTPAVEIKEHESTPTPEVINLG